MIKVGEEWRHKKTGGIYVIVAIDAAVQCSSVGELGELLEDEDWIAYRPIDGNRLSFRMREEFLGRFEKVKDAE